MLFQKGDPGSVGSQSESPGTLCGDAGGCSNPSKLHQDSLESLPVMV
jgi:hypothetical protein